MVGGVSCGSWYLKESPDGGCNKEISVMERSLSSGLVLRYKVE